MTENAIDLMLNPRSVAIVGASNEPGKRGNRAVRILLDDGYAGHVYPVNPREAEVCGLPCHPDLASIGRPVDVAMVCTPARTLPGVLVQCGAAGIRGAIVVSGGFSEAGPEGLALEEASLAVAREQGVRILGPNMNGVWSRRHACNLSPWREVPVGGIAVLSNSANIVHWLLTKAWARGGIGFSTLLSVGNQADVQFHELVASLGDDPDTRAIVLYAEGFRDGRAFADAVRAVAPRKPVVVYKAGRNAEGARMAKSHSGSLAGDYAVSHGALVQAGATLVAQAEHLLPVAEALAATPAMRSRSVAVISEGGGPITIASEALVERGLRLEPLGADTQARIHAIIPASTTIANPVDIAVLTAPSAANYGRCAEAILDDAGIDALLFVGWFGAYGRRVGGAVADEELRVAEALCAAMRATGKPIVVQSHYAAIGTPPLDALRAGGVPVHQDFGIAVECIGAAADRGAFLRRLAEPAPPAAAPPGGAAAAIEGLRARGRTALSEHDAKDVLEAAGIAVPPRRLLRDESDVPAAIGQFGDLPLALKLMSADILHKSEAGAVRLGVRGERAVAVAVRELLETVRVRNPAARVDGVLATPMAARGTELIVGMTRDPQFGPVVAFGLGGTLVEAIRDVVFRPVPLSPADAREMIAGLRHAQVLDGVRGMPPVDRDAIAGLLLAVSGLASGCPEIVELDLNPVIGHATGCSIVDARIVLAPGPD